MKDEQIEELARAMAPVRHQYCDYGLKRSKPMAVDLMLANACEPVIDRLVSEAREEGRQQGQGEGMNAATLWLRERGATKPPASLWHAALLLADQLEQSRIPASPETDNG